MIPGLTWAEWNTTIYVLAFLDPSNQSYLKEAAEAVTREMLTAVARDQRWPDAVLFVLGKH